MPRHLKLFLFATLLCVASALFGRAEAATRFWVPVVVTGAADNGSGACRLTVGAGLATGKVTGETVVVAAITGATGCNVTTTITAIDSTHIDLVGTTFGGVYVSGGTITGGTWNSTNIGNWGTASGTGSGAAVPTTSDAITFDATGGNVLLGASYTPLSSSITISANITFDNSVNNDNITINGAVGWANTATATVKLGSGTYTVTAGPWAMAVGTNSDCCASATLAFGTGGHLFTGGGKTYGAMTNGGSVTTVTSVTVTSVSLSGVGSTFIVTLGTTFTITNAISWVGTNSNALVLISTGTTQGTLSLTAGGTITWSGIRLITFAGTLPTITNSLDLHGNTGGATISPPSGGGTTIVGGIIGGGL